GDPTAEDTRALLKVVYGHYRPSKVVAVGLPDDDGETVVPLLAGRSQLEGRATAYVCRRFTCERPATTPAELAEQLRIEWAG
ncbi:MAG: thioredoxin domain-containing protein, partial [Anaerolineae bacterium]